MELFPPQYLRDIAANIRKSPLTLAHLCLRDVLDEGPDLIALMATRGAMGYRDALASVRALLSGELDTESAVDLFDVAALAALARLMAGRPGPGLDYSDSADIAQAVRRIRRGAPLPRDTDRIEVQVSLAAGRFDHVESHMADYELDDVAAWMVRTELMHPHTGRPGSLPGPWLQEFNGIFGADGLLPVSLASGPGSPFDRLIADVPEAMKRKEPDDPLVTVIMSTFRPTQSLLTAVASLIGQTWRNLEILLVDDCSPPEFEHLLHEAEGLDPRVTLIRMKRNGGTYKIRNHAIAVATGEFVTFKDSDDWAHPERIERQMAPLLESDDYVATMCDTIRVHPDLGVNSVGMSTSRICPSSPLFRRARVMEVMGSFDEVRKSADTEFTVRLRLAFGLEAVPVIQLPLVLTQLTSGSLSRAEYGFGWHHGARVTYREAYRHWHSEIESGLSSPFLDPAAVRRFVAPDRFFRTGQAAPQECDVLLMSDWGRGRSRYVGEAREVRALSEAGLTTVVAQAQTIRFAHRIRRAMTPAILDLQESGHTRVALWDEDLHTRLLIVRDPELLAVARPADRLRFSADRVVIVAAFPCRTPGGWLTYDPAQAENHAREMFGTEPIWLPGHAGIAHSLREEGARGEILPPRRVGAVTVRRRSFIGLRGGPRPVVGTTGLLSPLKDRPSAALLRQLLPTDDAYDVRIRARSELVEKIFRHRRLPADWLVMEEEESAAFFKQLDVFVGIPMRSWGPELSWATRSALAHGVVAILDPSYEEQFGDAAVYARPDEVAGVLSTLVNDPELFSSQQFRGYEFCRTELSAKTLVDLVRSLGVDADDEKKVLS